MVEAYPTPAPRLPQSPLVQSAKMHVKRVTLTSKKNWWMVELDQEDEKQTHPSIKSFPSSEETAVVPDDGLFNRKVEEEKAKEIPSPNPSIPIFKCIVKKPDVIQLEINGEMQSNASDVTTQFLAELRVYTTVSRHRNITAFLGCLENVGMVLEYIDGRTLYEVIRPRPVLTRKKKIDFYNQLLDGLTHLHSFRLSHGDLSLLNIQVTHSSDTIKLFDFGRSVSMDSVFISPSDEPVDPFQYIAQDWADRSCGTAKEGGANTPRHTAIAAPEVLRGECQDPLLADAYSFGMILVAIDRVEVVDLKPWEQRKDVVPESLFEGCEVFEEAARQYLRRCDSRRRLSKHDMMMVVDE
ncbi:kinase-like protein [Suillus cothurnatus]|nr:kinase-like protein [Suillus cothurnatus]